MAHIKQNFYFSDITHLVPFADNTSFILCHYTHHTGANSRLCGSTYIWYVLPRSASSGSKRSVTPEQDDIKVISNNGFQKKTTIECCLIEDSTVLDTDLLLSTCEAVTDFTLETEVRSHQLLIPQQMSPARVMRAVTARLRIHHVTRRWTNFSCNSTSIAMQDFLLTTTCISR